MPSFSLLTKGKCGQINSLDKVHRLVLQVHPHAKREGSAGAWSWTIQSQSVEGENCGREVVVAEAVSARNGWLYRILGVDRYPANNRLSLGVPLEEG